MANKLAPLTLFQWGRELPAAQGTAVAATSQIAVPDIQFEAIDTIVRPEIARGYTLGCQGGEFVSIRGTKWTVPEHALNFQQILHWLGMTVGLITPLPTASPAGVFTWVFSSPLSGAMAPETFTLERRLSDGSAFTDFEWAYAFGESFAITGKPNGECMLTVQGQARKRQNSVFTTPLNGTAVLNATSCRAQLKFADTYAGLADGAVLYQVANVIDWTLKFQSGFKPQYTADNRADQDFSTVIYDPRARHFSLDATIYVSSQWAAELVKAESVGSASLAGIRYFRLQITHPTFITGANTYLLQFDLVALHTQGSLVKIGEQDGQCIFALSVTETADGVNPPFVATLRNNAGAYT